MLTSAIGCSPTSHRPTTDFLGTFDGGKFNFLLTAIDAHKVKSEDTMALQLSLRRGLPALKASKGSVGTSFLDLSRRFKSTDVGDVIGIDLGTTNSCVAVMVRISSPLVPYRLYACDENSFVGRRNICTFGRIECISIRPFKFSSMNMTQCPGC